MSNGLRRRKKRTAATIHEQTDSPRGSIGTTLSRLERHGLVRHKGDYWAAARDDRLASYTAMILGVEAVEERYADDGYAADSDWAEDLEGLEFGAERQVVLPQGTVVVGPDRVGPRGRRPYIVLSNAAHSFHGQEYIAVACATTEREEAVPMNEHIIEGSLPKVTFVSPGRSSRSKRRRCRRPWPASTSAV